MYDQHHEAAGRRDPDRVPDGCLLEWSRPTSSGRRSRSRPARPRAQLRCGLASRAAARVLRVRVRHPARLAAIRRRHVRRHEPAVRRSAGMHRCAGPRTRLQYRLRRNVQVRRRGGLLRARRRCSTGPVVRRADLLRVPNEMNSRSRSLRSSAVHLDELHARRAELGRDPVVCENTIDRSTRNHQGLRLAAPAWRRPILGRSGA